MALVIGLEPIQATIASGTSLSAGVPLGAKTLVGIAMPAVWTAAGLSFQASVDGTTWLDMYDGTGSEKVLSVAANRLVTLDPAEWASFNYLKVRSGTAAVGVNQGADRIVTLMVRSI